MTWEWKIGDPVDDATGGSMDAMNWGHGSDDKDKNNSQDLAGQSSYQSYSSGPSPMQKKLSQLSTLMGSYKYLLEKARSKTTDNLRIQYYLEALDSAERYFETSEKLGVSLDEMPDREHLLSEADIDWISKKHYDEYYKIHIISTDQTESLEKLLRQSGNAKIIQINEDTRREREKEAARKREFDYVRYLKRDYFERIEKAEEFFLKNKPSKAIREYQKAVDVYVEFFESGHANVEMRRGMPEKSLNDHDLDNIMDIYVKTHPLLSKGKGSAETNRQIIDLLNGEWDERLSEADIEAGRILEARKLERQQRIEKAQDIAVDVIVGARIVKDSIFKRIKRQ